MTLWVRRGVLALVIGLVLLALGRGVVRWLASDETRIRWRIESMLAGFSAGRVRPVLAGIHPEFVDESSGASRDDVHRALLHLFLTVKDPQTKAFRLRAELATEELEVRVVQGEPRTAEVELRAHFRDVIGEHEETWWDARAVCDWRLEDGRWKLVRSRSVNHRERR